MGAWGTGFFDDDTHSDFLYNVLENDMSPESFGQYFENGIEAEEYLDYDVGAEIIVSAALIDAILNGTKLDCVTEGVDEWLVKHKDDNVQPLKAKAVQALEKVIGEDSELNELWKENEEDYPEWKGLIEQLIARLN